MRPCHVWLVWWWYCGMTVWCGIPPCRLYQTRRPCCKSLLLDSAVLFHAVTQLSLLLALEGATESVETHCQCWNSCTAARAAPCRLGNPRRTWSTTGKHDKSWADKATHEQYSGKLILSFSRLGSWKYRRREIRFNCHLKTQLRRNYCWQNSLYFPPRKTDDAGVALRLVVINARLSINFSRRIFSASCAFIVTHFCHEAGRDATQTSTNLNDLARGHKEER